MQRIDIAGDDESIRLAIHRTRENRRVEHGQTDPGFSPDENTSPFYSVSYLDRPEYSLRLYRSADVKNFLKRF